MLDMSSTDLALFKAITDDDEQAFNLLFKRHWLSVYVIAYKYVRDKESCLEITHDIFLNIWQKRHELQIRCFKNYVVTAANYHGMRKRQIMKAVPITCMGNFEYTEDFSTIGNHTVAVNMGEANMFTTELNDKVDSLIADLPKRCREIYIMSRKENLTISEIAERLDISKRTVENQLSSALRHLRASLSWIFR
jgi:RNA polymerase sigma-70 factor (family 1)